MKLQKISKLLRDYLLLKHEVHVPGLGCFYAQPQKAVLTATHSKISPPEIKFLFVEETSQDDSFISFVAEVLETDILKAEKKVRKFTQVVFNKLLNFKKVAIPHIGDLIQSNEQELDYFPDKTLIQADNRYLPIIDIKPVLRESKEVIIEEAIKDNNFYQSDFLEDAEEEGHLVETGSNRSLFRSSWLTVIIPFLFISILSLAIWKSCKASEKEGISTHDSVALSQDTMQEESYVADKEDILSIEDNKKTALDDISNIHSSEYDAFVGKKCIIIVGAYGSQRNIDIMIQKLEKAGLTVYTENINALTRVGFSFICQADTNLSQYLDSIRSDFTPNAWYLYPQFDE